MPPPDVRPMGAAVREDEERPTGAVPTLRLTSLQASIAIDDLARLVVTQRQTSSWAVDRLLEWGLDDDRYVEFFLRRIRELGAGIGTELITRDNWHGRLLEESPEEAAERLAYEEWYAVRLRALGVNIKRCTFSAGGVHVWSRDSFGPEALRARVVRFIPNSELSSAHAPLDRPRSSCRDGRARIQRRRDCARVRRSGGRTTRSRPAKAQAPPCGGSSDSSGEGDPEALRHGVEGHAPLLFGGEQ